MFGRLTRISSALALLGAAACGGGDLDVYNASTPDSGEPEAADTDTQLDMGATPDPNNVQVSPDMGPIPVVADMDVVDVMMPNPDPTMNVPQEGPTVGEQVASACSTIAVKGLSVQLIDQMNCLDPGVMKSFDGAPGLSYGAVVFPFQQGPATDTLTAVAANNPGTMPISSALRTLPQQYLLYEWYNRSLCNANLAASPGRSNHNGGLALDIGDSGVWRTPMRAASYVDNVSGEPWHFYYSGAGGKDVRNLSVLAFQQLYNYNFPENAITEDGLYGPMTEAALVSSPANGFAEQRMCPATMSFVAYPHRTPLDVSYERIGEGLIGVRTLAPGGVELVEIYVNGRLAGFADRDAMQFETVVPLSMEAAVSAIEVVAYDRRGAERARAIGAVESRHDAAIFVRPMGGDNYEIGIDDLPNDVHDVDYFLDGVLLEQEDWLAVSNDRRRRAAQLRGAVDLDVVMLDAKQRVVDMRTVHLAL